MSSAFVCDLSALTPAQRDRHRELAKRLRPSVLEFIEVADGYSARFESEPDRLVEVAEFVELERRCCPFLTLTLTAEREDGPLTLTVTGPEGVKPFIRAEFGIPGDWSRLHDHQDHEGHVHGWRIGAALRADRQDGRPLRPSLIDVRSGQVWTRSWCERYRALSDEALQRTGHSASRSGHGTL